MLTKTLKKIKVIQTDDRQLFETLFNRATEELSEKGTEFETDIQPFTGTHCAYILYTEIKREFNLVSDEFHEQGIHYLCGQCSLHDPQEDGRQKRVYCKYADCGMTDVRHEVCEMFYKKVKQGEIKPLY